MDSELYKAATQGDVQKLKCLIQKDRTILNSVTPQENTALHLAARHGHKPFAQEILKECSTLLIMRNNDKDTPLHIAARAGQLEIVTLLIDKAFWPPDIESGGQVGPLRMTNRMRNTPLHEAVKNHYSEIAKKLLDAEPSAGHVMNKKGETPLHTAAREGLKDVVSEILQHPWVEEREEEEPPFAGTGSPLHQAVLGGHLAIVEMLLEKRNDYTKVIDKYGNNALHYAAQKNSGKMVELLLKNKPSLAYDKNSDTRSSLHVAAAYNSSTAIKEILKLCPDAAEQLDDAGRNALHIAVISGTIKALKCLLKNLLLEEIINQADHDGNTPLHLAAKNSRIRSTVLLLEDKRVDPCIVNHGGNTARRIIESLDNIDAYEMHLWRLLKKSEESRCKEQQLSEPWLNRLVISLKKKLSESDTTLGSFKKKPYNVTSTANEHFKASAETYAVVSALIATVTFAAIITMPGGYSQDHGYALLAKHAAFKVFVISNTIAMCSSLIVALCFIWAWKDPLRFRVKQLIWGHRLTVIASLAMLVALMTAVYVVVESQCKWVAIVVCVICCSAPFVLWAILGRDIWFIPV